MTKPVVVKRRKNSWGTVSLRIQRGESCIPRLRDCILNWKFKTFCPRYPSYIFSVQLSPSVDTFPELQLIILFYWIFGTSRSEDGDGGSTDVSGRRTSTGSEALSLLICLDATRSVWLGFFALDDLPKNLFKSTAEECKKSTSGWRSSLKNRRCLNSPIIAQCCLKREIAFIFFNLRRD